MITPIRIQRSRTNKQVSPNGLPIVYVGRPSIWGNPFTVTFEINGYVVKDKEGNYYGEVYNSKTDAIDKAIECFTGYIEGKIHIGSRDIEQLRGKNLSCWCSLDCKCHADILLKLANE